MEKEWFCLIKFETPVQCPSDSIVIATKLDAEAVENVCRIAFHGNIIETLKADGSGKLLNAFMITLM